MLVLQVALFGPNGFDQTSLTPAGALALGLRGIQIALALVGAVALVYILIAGIQYVTSGGDPKKQGDAKKAIQAAIIGFVVAVGAFTLTNTLLQRLQFKDTILPGNVETKPLQPYLQK